MMKKRTYSKQVLQLSAVAIAAIFYLTAFIMVDKEEVETKKLYGPEDWADFKSWYKITKEPNTGDPTGFLQGKHGGTKAWRDIFINDIGKEGYLSEEFPLPEGTIIVKEAYANEKAYNAQKNPTITVMVKSNEEGSEDTGNFLWYIGGNGKYKQGAGLDTKWGEFCGSCHALGQVGDFTFMSIHRGE